MTSSPSMLCTDCGVRFAGTFNTGAQPAEAGRSQSRPTWSTKRVPNLVLKQQTPFFLHQVPLWANTDDACFWTCVSMSIQPFYPDSYRSFISPSKTPKPKIPGTERTRIPSYPLPKTPNAEYEYWRVPAQRSASNYVQSQTQSPAKPQLVYKGT